MPRLKGIGGRLSTSAAPRLRTPPKAADPQYHSQAHRDWRAAVMRRAGGRCQAPGCGRADTRLFADHIVELRDGGSPTDPANGQALCGACHTRKTAAARAARRFT